MAEYRNWIFKVSCEVKPGEQVYVVGSCPELGNWNSQKPLSLEPETSKDGSETFWRGISRLTSKEVSFRYCVSACVNNEELNEKSYVVLRWETNLFPRTIPASQTNLNDTTVDIFGCNHGIEKIDQGWLVKDSLIQLKLFKSDIYSEAIVLWGRKYKEKKLFVKVTAIDMSCNLNRSATDIDSAAEESAEVELTQMRNLAMGSWPNVQVAVMKDGESEFHPQEQFGVECLIEEMIIFQCRALEPSSVSFLLDYYIENPGSEMPKFIGCSHILPSTIKENFGVINQPITSKKQVPIGHLTVHYLIVHPLENPECDMEVSYARYWKAAWTGLEVGHRGAGNSFHSQTTSCANIRENTIASLKFAAENGADMVEFDVQLSKDLVPVLYHDFHACISLKRRKESVNENLLEIPIKDLTVEQLQALKLYHRSEKGYDKFSDFEQEDHESFPTLEKAMCVVPDSCGFNIEIKWTMRRKDGTYELEHPFELNRFIDIILKVVLESSTKRKIIFSCFHPDICTMIRMKQNRYPVLFLTPGNYSEGMPYEDIRTRSFQHAVHFAASTNILGVNVESKTLLRDTELIKLAFDKKQVVFCWGDGNNDSSSIKFLKKLGLHGIIYDKIDVYNTKSTKESVFLCENQTAQTCILASYKKSHIGSESPTQYENGESQNGICKTVTPTFSGVLQRVGS